MRLTQSQFVRMAPSEKEVLLRLSDLEERNPSDIVRRLIRRATRGLESQKELARRAGAETRHVLQTLANSEVISKNQSVHITAQNVIIQGSISQTTFGAGEPPKEKKPIWKILGWIKDIALFLAAIVTILAYFKISPL